MQYIFCRLVFSVFLVSCPRRDIICPIVSVQTLGCTDVEVMTVDNIEDNLDASSNPESVSNIVPKKGVPDYWKPSPDDDEPTLRVTLPVVNGVSPKDYEVMVVRIKAENFDMVTVTVTDTEDNVVFTVSFLLRICGTHYALTTSFGSNLIRSQEKNRLKRQSCNQCGYVM